MESIFIQKVQLLIDRLDLFEKDPKDFILVDSMLTEVKRREEKGLSYTSPEVIEILNELRYKKFALLYRLEKDAILGSLFDIENLSQTLLQLLAEWIYKYPGFNRDTFDLQPSEKIDFVVERYPAFSELLIADESLRVKFFKWAIRDNNAVTPFVLFPATMKLLTECNLSQRIGYYKGYHLEMVVKVDHDKNRHVFLTLPFEGEKIPVWDLERKVKLKDGSVRTVEEIYKVFRGKVKKPGDIEFLSDGVTYFPSYELWKVTDLTDPKFYEKMPLLKLMTVSDAIKRFGKTVAGLDIVEEWVSKDKIISRGENHFIEHPYSLLNLVEVLEEKKNQYRVKMRRRLPVDGKTVLLSIRATCERPMSLLRTHAFSDTLIPKDGYYLVFNEGKYPLKYPDNALKLLLDFVRTVIAALQVNDDNTWFNHRDHTEEALGLTTEQGNLLMEIKRFLFILARDDKLAFEFQSEGCAKMQQVDIFKLLLILQKEKFKTVDEVANKIRDLIYSQELEKYDMGSMPNFFRTSLQQVYPEGFLGSLYSLIRMAPVFVQPWLISVSYLIFGAWRGVNIHLGDRDIDLKHLHSSCWRDPTNPYSHSLYHPGFMHEQQKKVGITQLTRKIHALEGDPRIHRQLLKMDFS